MTDVYRFIQENMPRSVHYYPEDIDNLYGLPYPYTVPSPDEMFREMYYWDTYFTNVGLIASGNVTQAKNNTDNVRHMIHRFGYMLNANRTHFKSSQPPYDFKMVEDVYAVLPDDQWLSDSYDAIAKEYSFWMTRRIAPNGLNVYGADVVMDEDYVERRYRYFVSRFVGFHTDDPEMKRAAAHTINSLCEAGWDCSTRFEVEGHHYNAVDLNALLYGLEKAMARFSRILRREEEQLWEARAANRKAKMDELLFNKEAGLYLDWNFVKQKHSPVQSVMSFVPLFVGMDCPYEKAFRFLEEKLLMPYGVGCTPEGKYTFELQWQYPNVWAPPQYITYVACKNFGYNDLAETIAKRYAKLLETNFSKTQNLWEKYDGNTAEVVSEEYDAPPMLGWTAGIYLFFAHILGKN